MARKWDKFMLLLWKNWVLQYRQPIQTLIEIIVPVIFSFLLVYIRSSVTPEKNDSIVYPSFCTIPLPNSSDICGASGSSFAGINISNNASTPIPLLPNYTIIYSPRNDALANIMKPFGFIFNVNALRNSKELEDYYIAYGKDAVFAGLQFDDNLGDASKIDDHVKVNIRFPSELRATSSQLSSLNTWLTYLIFPIFEIPGPRDKAMITGGIPSYHDEGFLAVQHLLSVFITLNKIGIDLPDIANGWQDWQNLMSELKNSTDTLPFITMRRFPYAAWQNDWLLQALQSFVGLIVMLSFVYTSINTVKALTAEKEKQLKEAMKIMGLPNWLHWTAWFLKTFSYLFVSICLMVILLKVRWYSNTDFTVFTYSNAGVILLFLFFYVCSTITFCFAVSVFFSKANTAATLAGLAWFLSYAPYLSLQQDYETLSLHAKLLSSLGSNTAMAFGFQLMIMFEGNAEGIQWDNIWKTTSPDDNLTLGLVMVMLVVDTFIYLLIALYVEAVFPGEYGVPQPWYFPFTKSFWCGNSYIAETNDVFSEANSGQFFEPEPKNLHAGIKIKNLKKSFGGKIAVMNLSLNMYENQITALLGHNGAGKTTTMSMLTGMFTPSSGTAVISGYDIRTNIDGVRDSLGLCPQHNVIFDDLTVAEHIYFFSRLKGMNKKEIKSEIDKYVKLLELENKRDARSKTLSGGMKRKLCVGMALCGNSKVVMLDEPTAGMDPSARRALWDLLLKLKIGRTILLTTHFMDEADLLGDRIAIMAGGQLQCCGSSFFLKKKYGAGYQLVIDKTQQCDPAKITEVLRKHIPNIEISSNVGSELTYLLAEDQSPVFETMLKDLEEGSQWLNVNSYGISLTTLEEVFMRVGADNEQEENCNGNEVAKYDQKLFQKNQDTKIEIQNSSKTLSSFNLLLNQFLAMLMKKALSTWRSWILLVIQVFLPVIFLIIVMLVSRQRNNLGDLPSMPLDISKFSSPVLLLEGQKSASGYDTVYENILGDVCHKVDDIQGLILNMTKETPITVRRNYLGGASFAPLSNNVSSLGIFDVNFTVYFNADPYHTPGIALSYALDTMYRKVTKCSDCSIQFVNDPMPYTAETKVNNMNSVFMGMGFNLAFNMTFSMSFVSAFYVLFIVRERVTKSKHLQFVSGVKVFIFWFTNWLCDVFTFLLTVCALLITLICFQEDGFKTAEDIGRIFVILCYFAWAMLPMMYICGFMFDIPATGFTRMTMINIFTGIAAFLVVQILSQPGINLEHIGKSLNWVFLILPHYSLATGLKNVYTLYSTNEMCNEFFDSSCKTACQNCTTHQECLDKFPSMKDYCEDLTDSAFSWSPPAIGANLVYSLIVGAVLFISLLLTDYRILSRIVFFCEQRISSRRSLETQDEDSDVTAEKQTIRSLEEWQLHENYTMVLKDLTKYYKSFLAVNGLYLGVKKYECFGLLGINGAGKTTTFKMLTGDIKMSFGDAWVNGKNIKNEMKQVQKLIGYCPQFDALLDDMTARETIIMFALLRGIQLEEAKFIANKLAVDFDFRRHLDKKIKELSGGNKRKLSTSIALIGDPPVIYLDEPTTGMDPATKRYLWNALCNVRDSGKTIILTSHSMEECEALCTRLAIMVNGNFKCLGSTQHLKSKFAEGYTITIKVKKPEESSGNVHANTNNIEEFISKRFPGSTLREKHEELLTYYITDKSVPWSRMFGILEEAKKRGDLNIEDYCLGQSSLEQVFLTFTKHQIEVPS